jgi:hypothetical protein
MFEADPLISTKADPPITQITQINGVTPSGETVLNCHNLLRKDFCFQVNGCASQSLAIGEAEVSSAGEQLTKE